MEKAIITFCFLLVCIGRLSAQNERVQLKIFSQDSRNWENFIPQSPIFKSENAACLVTHGWSLFSRDMLETWMLDTAKTMNSRLGGRGNILAWEWIQEADGRDETENESVQAQGRLLAEGLKIALPQNYAQALQLIGHSLGTIVVTLASRELVAPKETSPRIIQVHQLTLWDPLDSFIAIDLSADVGFLRQHNVYAELYRGTTSTLDNRCNIIIDVPGITHAIYNWYATTITGENKPVVVFPRHCSNQNIVPGSIGFEDSPMLAPMQDPGANRIFLSRCQNNQSIIYVSRFSSCVADSGDEVFGADELRFCDENTKEFIRGDSNANQSVAIEDAIFTLNFLFRDGSFPPCMDAADSDDNGEINISDAIFILFALFAGKEIPPPYPDKGIDSTSDQLDCKA